MSTTNATPRRTKVEAGIYRRPDGALEIGWRDAQGKQRWRKVPGGIRAARAALAQAHAARARGERVAADPRLKFNDAADAWWDARAVKLRPTTQSVYAGSLAHLRRHFGRHRLIDISPGDVAAYVSIKQATLKGWSVKGHLTVLSSVFGYAGRHLGFVGANPLGLLDAVERPSTDDEKPKRILSPDELARLLQSVDPAYRLIFELEAETGGRLGEVLGLTWQDIDLEHETITFAAQLDRHGQRQTLKTKRSRRVLEVTPSLIAKLREHKLAQALSGPHDLVFVGRTGRGHDHRNIGGRVLTRAVERAGLEAVERDGKIVSPAPTFHSLRHSHASALIAQGWDIEEVSARLGHANVAVTQRVYAHAFDAARRSGQRRSRLATLYGSSVEAPLEAPEGRTRLQEANPSSAQITDLGTVRSARR